MDAITGQMKRPLLSIVTPVLNAEKLLNRYFFSLEKQTLSRSLWEIFIIDGGSTDRTREIAQKHHARVIHNPLRLAEPGVALGFQKAKGELIMILAADNIYKETNALEKIVSLLRDRTISAVFPKHDTASDDSIFVQNNKKDGGV
jgi:succinoglycan biosynthesis protein ExoA